MENYLARNLGGEDYNEFQSCKGKGRKSRPLQEAIIDRIQPEEGTDYLPLPKKETPRITTTSPPERGWWGGGGGGGGSLFVLKFELCVF